MIGFTDCCHHWGRVMFVSAQLLRQTGAMEPAGVGRRGSVLQSWCLVFGGGRGSFPSVVSLCRLWLTGEACPLQELTSGKCHDQLHTGCALPMSPDRHHPRQLQRAFLCAAGEAVGAATPLQRVSCFLAFYQCYTDACAGSSRKTRVSGRQWLSTEGVLP